jgi:DNA-binding transcriptional ArsR family regulator
MTHVGAFGSARHLQSQPAEILGRHTCILYQSNFSIDLFKRLSNNNGFVLAFAALADPTRRQIVEILAQRELAAGEIVEHFDFSPPAISQHLKVLREAKLVSVRIDAQRRIYGIDPEGFAELDRWLAQVKRFWPPKLDALDHELRKELRRRKK